MSFDSPLFFLGLGGETVTVGDVGFASPIFMMGLSAEESVTPPSEEGNIISGTVTIDGEDGSISGSNFDINSKPIEIKIRDGMAEQMRLNMLKSKGYYFNLGSVNVYEVPNVASWPRILIRIQEEINRDDDGFHPVNTHYTQRLIFNVSYQGKHEDDLEADADLLASRLAHDLKKFFGNYERLAQYKAYETRPTDYKINHSSNKNFPVSVDMTVYCEYYQLREEPTNG